MASQLPNIGGSNNKPNWASLFVTQVVASSRLPIKALLLFRPHAKTPSLSPLSMKMNIWNSKGAGNLRFRLHMQDLIRHHSLGILVLLETKLAGQGAEDVSSSLGSSKVHRVDVVGFRGGIWLLWNEH